MWNSSWKTVQFACIHFSMYLKKQHNVTSFSIFENDLKIENISNFVYRLPIFLNWREKNKKQCEIALAIYMHPLFLKSIWKCLKMRCKVKKLSTSDKFKKMYSSSSTFKKASETIWDWKRRNHAERFTTLRNQLFVFKYW